MFSEEYRQELLRIFEGRMNLPGVPGTCLREKIKEYPENVQEAFWYLYGTMPVSDIVNYPLEMMEDFAVHGAYLWEHSNFKGLVPEHIFTNYVLQHRVNDEEIEPCRTFFYRETQKIAQGRNLEDAAKEINYWCAGEVSYHTEDDRTASAMSVYRAAEGRCGEESVFVVNALRSAGIPARQVYSPYWSHCDDNHAWVEVWCGGEWHFLGACEPEEVLDRGWFVGAASRAMMVHTPLFEELFGENIKTAGKKKKAVLLNELHRYADTAVLHVKVQFPDGRGLPGAHVRCLVMNYASLLEIANGTTDAEGYFSLETGKGSLYIEVGYEGETGLFGGKYVNTEKETECIIRLSAEPWNFDVWEEMEFYAPKDGRRQGRAMTPEQKCLTKKKAEQSARHLEKKREEIRTVSGGEGLEKTLIDILAVKDVREINPEFIRKQAAFAGDYAEKFPEEIFISYLLQPRIGLERLSLLHEELGELIGEEEKRYLSEHPGEVRAFVEKRVSDSGRDDYKELLTAPAACIRTGVGSAASKEILIAAIYRILGIPSRLSSLDGTAQYYADGNFRRTDDMRTGRLFLEIPETGDGKWNYREDYSAAFLKNGEFVPCREVPAGEECEVLEGIYRICTANRLPNGNVYGKICYKKVSGSAAGEGITEMPAKVVLEKKQARLSEVLSQNPLPEIRLKTFAGEEVCAADAGIYIWAEPGQEPTEHIFNELIEKADKFQSTNIVVITKTEKECSRKTYVKLCDTLPHVQSLWETDDEQPSLLARKMYDEPEKFPFVLVLREGSVGIYSASGYNVGTADMLLQIIEGNLLK